MASRRSDIIDAIETRLNLISTANGYNHDIQLVSKRAINITKLKNDSALPALLLVYGRDGRKTDGPTQYAAVGQVEEMLPIVVRGIVEETDSSDPLTTLVADLHDDVETALGDDVRLGVSGVRNQRIARWVTGEGWGSPYEVIDFRVEVTHVYSKGQSV